MTDYNENEKPQPFELKLHPKGVHIYQFEDHVSMADGGGWWPGLFDTTETALYARAHSNRVDISKLSSVINHFEKLNRYITREDIDNGFDALPQ